MDAHSARFQTMDALRGVAAIAVLALHMHRTWVPLAGFAVDFFFMLSGFVIAFSYETRLRAGMGFRDFLLRRVIRLYPMIALGVALGFLYALFAIGAGVENLTIAQAGRLSLAALFLIPGPNPSPTMIYMFPLDMALWSLFFELAANIVYGLAGFRLSTRMLGALVAANLALIVAGGEVGGNMLPTFSLGFPRVGFGFFGGVLLYRLWRSGWRPPLRIGLIGLAVALVLGFVAPVSITGAGLIPAFAYLAAIVLLAAYADARGAGPLAKTLGDVSYPLYALHMPVWSIVAHAILMSSIDGRFQVFFGYCVAPVSIIAAAYAAFHWVDLPVRRRLAAWTTPRSAVPTAP